MDLYDRIERLRIMRPMKPMGILSGAHEQIVVSRGIDKFKRLHKLHAMYWEEPSTNKMFHQKQPKAKVVTQITQPIQGLLSTAVQAKRHAEHSQPSLPRQRRDPSRNRHREVKH